MQRNLVGLRSELDLDLDKQHHKQPAMGWSVMSIVVSFCMNNLDILIIRPLEAISDIFHVLLLHHGGIIHPRIFTSTSVKHMHAAVKFAEEA